MYKIDKLRRLLTKAMDQDTAEAKDREIASCLSLIADWEPTMEERLHELEKQQAELLREKYGR